jgi:hypothetical protein
MLKLSACCLRAQGGEWVTVVGEGGSDPTAYVVRICEQPRNFSAHLLLNAFAFGCSSVGSTMARE